MPYSIALTYELYRIRKVNPVNKSLLELCKIHKKYYNTYLGKANVNNNYAKLIAYDFK